MMDLGNPLHAYDFEKIDDHKIIVSDGYEGKFVTLDGKEHTISSEMLMISDSNKPIGIAGVMGGYSSQITEKTTKIVLEAAYFTPASVRQTAKKLGISTDASYRFERGTDINNTLKAIDKAAEMIAKLTGGKVLKEPIDIYPQKIEKNIINLRFDYARKIIGEFIPDATMRDYLLDLGFRIIRKMDNPNKEKHQLDVVVPYRRTDITEEIDLIEEIARLHGYHNIEPNFASIIDFNRDTIPTVLKPLSLRNKYRKFLSNKSYTELLTYNMIDPASASITHNKFVTIVNPLGEETSVMRPSMIQSILKVISFNLKQGNHNIKVFETGKYFLPTTNISNSFIEGIDEREQLIIALVGNSNPRQ